jgi:hypothetical protein
LDVVQPIDEQAFQVVTAWRSFRGNMAHYTAILSTLEEILRLCRVMPPEVMGEIAERFADEATKSSDVDDKRRAMLLALSELLRSLSLASTEGVLGGGPRKTRGRVARSKSGERLK